MGTRSRFAAAALLTAALTGHAWAGALTPMPVSLSFPDTGIGSTSATKPVQFVNNSGNAVTLATVTIGGANQTDFVLVNPPGLPIGIGAGGSVTFNVAFAPTGAGARTGALKAQVMGEMNTTDVALSGNGLGPKVTITPSPLVLGGLKFGQPVPALDVTCSNAGGSNVTVNGISITGPDAPRFGLVGLPQFGYQLAAGKSFSFQVTFTPLQAGKATATLVVDSNDPNTPQLSVPIVGNSGDPKISLSPGTIIFGNQRVGIQSLTQDVIITNTGLSDLHISAPLTTVGANATDFSFTMKPMLPLTLPIGGTATFSVAFTPAAAGARSGAVQITSDDPNAPMKMLSMSGVGTTPAASVTPAMIDFGKVRVGQAGNQSLTITNKGTGPVLVDSLQITGNDKALFSANLAAPFTVAPMSSTIVQLTYRPMVVVGAANATVTLTTDDPNLPMAQVKLVGSSTAPMFSLAPDRLDFGGVLVGQMSDPKMFSILNTGNQVLTIQSFRMNGPGQMRYTVVPKVQPGTTVPAGGSIMFTVTYLPTDPSNDDAQVLITVDDPANPDGALTLSGYGRQAGIDVQPMDMDTIDFGTVTVGGSKTEQVKIQNTGDAPLEIADLKLALTGMDPMNPPMGPNYFTVDQRPPITILDGKTVTVNVTFAPKMAGMQQATLEIDPADMNLVPVTINLTGTAVAPMIDAAPATVDFGPVPLGETAAPQTITISNGGTKAQTVDRVESDDSHFAIDTTRLNRSLPGGAKTTVNVTFTPDAAGTVTGHVNVYITGSAMPVATVTVTGQGQNGTGGPPSDRGGCSLARGSAGRAFSAVGLLAFAALALVVRRRRRAHRS